MPISDFRPTVFVFFFPCCFTAVSLVLPTFPKKKNEVNTNRPREIGKRGKKAAVQGSNYGLSKGTDSARWMKEHGKRRPSLDLVIKLHQTTSLRRKKLN